MTEEPFVLAHQIDMVTADIKRERKAIKDLRKTIRYWKKERRLLRERLRESEAERLVEPSSVRRP